MKSTRRRDLFGGALFSAGLLSMTAAPALANELIWDPDTTHTNRASVGLNGPAVMPKYVNHYYAFDSATAQNSPIGSMSGSYVGLDSGAVYSSLSILSTGIKGDTHGTALAYINYAGTSYGNVYANVGGFVYMRLFYQPLKDIQLRVSWDNFNGSTDLFIGDSTYSDPPLFNISTYSGEVGELFVTLEAGKSYELYALAVTRVFSTQERHAQFEFTIVPAPGALALLGVAGLIGKRRRRE